MKKKHFYLLLVALFAVLPFSLSSCSSDDDDDSEVGTSSIVGTWELTGGNAAIGEFEYGDFCFLRFKKDGSFVTVSGEDGDVDIDYGTWTFSDNNIYITLDEITTPYTVTSLTSKKMTFTILGMATWELTKVKDSKMDAYLKDEGDTSDGKLKVNGTEWSPSTYVKPSFTDYFNGSDCYLVHMDFYRKNSDIFSIYANQIIISFTPDDIITEGEDLADISSFEVSYSENTQQEDESKPWKVGIYKKKTSGHAYVKKYEKNKTLTVQFSNLKLKYSGSDDDNDYDSSYDVSHPSTLTLDGTVTFKYDKGFDD